jgi:hypothetical protein
MCDYDVCLFLPCRTFFITFLVFKYSCIHTYICMLICMLTYIHACMHAYMQVYELRGISEPLCVCRDLIWTVCVCVCVCVSVYV